MSDPKPKIKSTSTIKEALHDKNIASAVGMHQMNFDAKQRVEGYLKFCEERKKAKKAKDNAQGPAAAASAVANQALPSLGDFNFTDLREFIAEVTAQPCDTKEHFEVYDNDRKKLSKILAAAIERLNGDRVLDLIALKVPLDDALTTNMLGVGELGKVFSTPMNYTLAYVTKYYTVSANKVSALDLSKATFIIIDLINAGANVNRTFSRRSNIFIHHLVIAASQTTELLPLLEFVLARNCDINVLNNLGKTPLFAIIDLIMPYAITLKGPVFRTYSNSKAVKEVIKQLVSTGKQKYHHNTYNPPTHKIFNVVCAWLGLVKDPDHIEGLNIILEDMRRQALEHFASLEGKEYRDLQTELKAYTDQELATPLNNQVGDADYNDYRRSMLFNNRFYEPVFTSVKESWAEGFSVARMMTVDYRQQYILPVCWGIVKDYLKTALLNQGYELGLHLALPETTTTDALAIIVSSTRVVAKPMRVVQSSIELNVAFTLNPSNEFLAAETTISRWDEGLVAIGTAKVNNKSANSENAAINCSVASRDIKTENETKAVREGALCYQYRRSVLSMFSPHRIEKDDKIVSFTVQPSHTAVDTHTVIRHFRDGVPSPSCLVFYKEQCKRGFKETLNVALKKEYSDDPERFSTSSLKRPFDP